MKQWYYTKVGIQQGPVPEDELLRKIRRGEIGDSNLLWSEGMGDWLPFAQIQELRDGSGDRKATEESPPPQPTGPFTGSATPLSPRQMPQPEALSAQNIGHEIPTYLAHSLVALVVSILMATLMCLPPLGLPFAIVAVVYATKVDGLKARGDVLGARTTSKNAKLWMLISFGASALMVVGLVIGIAVLFLNS